MLSSSVSKIIFFNGATWLLSYQLHQLSVDSVMKKKLCCWKFAILLKQSEISLSASHLQAKNDPLSMFRGTSVVQVITDLSMMGSDTATITLCWALHDGVSASTRWEMRVSKLICVAVLARGRVIGKMQLTQLPYSCSVRCLGNFEFLHTVHTPTAFLNTHC